MHRVDQAYSSKLLPNTGQYTLFKNWVKICWISAIFTHVPAFSLGATGDCGESTSQRESLASR